MQMNVIQIRCLFEWKFEMNLILKKEKFFLSVCDDAEIEKVRSENKHWMSY